MHILQGPLTVFNAKSQWSSPRVVTMVKSDLFPGFGFSVKGDTPASISSVEPGGLADVRTNNILYPQSPLS